MQSKQAEYAEGGAQQSSHAPRIIALDGPELVASLIFTSNSIQTTIQHFHPCGRSQAPGQQAVSTESTNQRSTVKPHNNARRRHDAHIPHLSAAS